jgi:Skp family chaperone for outer membrane proteins
MKTIKKIIFLSIFFLHQNSLLADNPFYLDFKYVLNESAAGKQVQTFLKNKLDNGIKSLRDKEKKLQEEEKKIIQQKKVISAEEYKKKVTDLRSNVLSLQKERDALLENVSKQRAKARAELLKNLNPIMKNYMLEKNIRMIIDKKSMLLADENLNITDDIIKILNIKLKSIKLN